MMVATVQALMAATVQTVTVQAASMADTMGIIIITMLMAMAIIITMTLAIIIITMILAIIIIIILAAAAAEDLVLALSD
jgi:hypothetical protein